MSQLINQFEIRDPAVDTEEIRKKVNENIKQRRNYAQSHSIDFEQLAQPVNLNEEARRWTLDLVEYHRASLLISPYTIPANSGMLGYFLVWIKRQAHNLVIYYVNMSGRKQLLFNESVAEAMAIYQVQIESLQEKINSLEEKIQKLEVQLLAIEAGEHE